MNTSTGLPRNTAAALSYILGPFTGIIFLVVEKDKFVRFHALQSTIFSAALLLLAQFFSYFPLLTFLSSLFGLVWLALTLFMVVQAHQGIRYEMPWAGRLTKRLLRKA